MTKLTAGHGVNVMVPIPQGPSQGGQRGEVSGKPEKFEKEERGRPGEGRGKGLAVE